ncbi:hypothetical protein GWK48_09440 [Metallosphaera tengchongensis]|uniref:Uncharacterized protein n=1 Tax=Metallosphaera tengchongensis TaxID=1532350 RepID=A0A6N0NV23_9CREN|nr:hypothetical protein [Metallosphaera tengchongensis]QKR00572.1 hypothetical protein GWK48_09440 [Metallosphaera tengchongensis]
MSCDERTTAEDFRIELHLNPFTFRETTLRYRVIEEDNWLRLTGKEGDYLAKDFESYAILLFPIQMIPREVLNSLDVRLTSIDMLREVLMKPNVWRDYLTLRVREGRVITADLMLENFMGRDLVNDIIADIGVKYVEGQDGLEISSILTNFSWRELNEAFKRISFALSLYNQIRRNQEEIALNLANSFMTNYRSRDTGLP